MTVRLTVMGLLAYPMTQTRHGVCYLSRKGGRPPSESNKILIFYLTRRVLELTQQHPACFRHLQTQDACFLLFKSPATGLEPHPQSVHRFLATSLGGLLRGPNRTLGHWASRRNTPEFGFFRFPILDEYEYRIARYGNVWTSDDSNKAWGMLFESEGWPAPFRVK